MRVIQQQVQVREHDGQTWNQKKIIDHPMQENKPTITPKAVDKQQGVETLLSELTSRFINQLDTPLEDLMNWAVARTGQEFDVDRVCIVLYNPENKIINKTFTWNHPDCHIPNHIDLQSFEPFQWTVEQVRQMKVTQLDDLSQLPEEADYEKQFYQKHHFRSIVEFPLHINQNTYGLISFVRIRRKKAWSNTEIRQQRMISDVLANSLSRIVAEQELNRTIRRFQVLYNHSPIAIWEEDFSQAKACLNKIECQNSDELRSYLHLNPNQVHEILSKIKVVDVNETTVKLWKHAGRDNVVGNLKTTLPEENLDRWIEELIAIAEGRLYYLIEDQLVASNSGEILHANLYWNVVPGHEKDWSQVLVSAVDITKQIQTEKSLHESEERLRMMLENAEDIILLQNLNGKYLYYNGLPRYGMTTEDMVGKYPSDLHEPMIAEEIMQSLMTVSHTKKPVVVEIPRFWGGETNWFSNLLYPVFSPEGEVVAVGTISRNITKRKETEKTLADVQKKLSSRVMELEKRNQEISLLSEMLTMLQFCSELDEAYKIIHQFLQQLFPGLSGSLLEIQSNQTDLYPRLTWGLTMDPMQIYRLDDCWAVRSGKKYFVEDSNQAVMCKHILEPFPKNSLCTPYIVDGSTAGCLHLQTTSEKSAILESDHLLAQSATEQIGLALTNIRLRIGLRLQAIHDALTGLYNRHYLDEYITRELYRQERSGQPLSLIMMDLDHLKQINDFYGHAAGDAVLRELGKLLKRSIRVSDIPCRYGGDEFILVMPDTSIETAFNRAEKIAYSFKQLSIPYGTQTLGEFSLSIGVSSTIQHGHTSQDLINAADQALYKAKRTGRDKVIMADALYFQEKDTGGLA